MAIATTQISVTGEWQKIADEKCILQSEEIGIIYDFSAGEANPTEASIYMDLPIPTTLDWGAPVWIRLNAKGNSHMSAVINRIA